MIHPETGEVLETREQFQAALGAIEEKMAPSWRLRSAIQAGYATEFESASLPVAHARTPTQDRVARCPRCGERLDRKYVLVSAQCYHGEHADCSMPSPYLCSCPCHKSEEAP